MCNVTPKCVWVTNHCCHGKAVKYRQVSFYMILQLENYATFQIYVIISGLTQFGIDEM
jgi:hypothetical protein